MRGEPVLTGARRRARLPLLLLIVVALAGIPMLAIAAAPSADEGKTLFQQKCSSCHTIGGGTLVGPDLAGVTGTRDHDWLVRWMSDPPGMVASGDPTATALLAQFNNVQMPNLGLSADQVDSLLAYLAAPSGAPTSPAATLPAGDAARGKEYFIGQKRFANGGPPCMACHSISGIGVLGGGKLGPDLTGSYAKWGPAGLTSFVTQPATVTMSAVWTQTPLTPQEGGDLIAFVQQASVSQRPANTVVQLAVLAVLVAVALLVVARLTWRERLTGVRRRMVANARR
ncbi:MAG TPA: c-type cytochrome [Thermomicrobiales bacterium]|jgi:mono/diheme cytochrome c family protein|nr:cytochrome C [Chloroflexota bacterium]HQX62091.1 c-type cytochrome [Thermomicrobiales bacterium]HBY47527.1 cytochrome C [Chloroflexota bacterium]HCG28841.1 cytochrome C [Chloroflexota bacterium]HQZ90446.1 c-type cytochrome [Thermomicrobiales bacterium]